MGVSSQYRIDNLRTVAPLLRVVVSDMNEGQHIHPRITSVTALILLSMLLSLSLITTLSDTSAIAPNENSRNSLEKRWRLSLTLVAVMQF